MEISVISGNAFEQGCRRRRQRWYRWRPSGLLIAVALSAVLWVLILWAAL